MVNESAASCAYGGSMVHGARITVAQLAELLLRCCCTCMQPGSAVHESTLPVRGHPHQLLQRPTLTATSGPTISLSLPARCRLLSHTWRLKSASDLLLYVMLCLTSHSRHAVVGSLSALAVKLLQGGKPGGWRNTVELALL